MAQVGLPCSRNFKQILFSAITLAPATCIIKFPMLHKTISTHQWVIGTTCPDHPLAPATCMIK
jgi:hypothetical protein